MAKKMLLKHLLESSAEIIQGFRKHHHIKLLKFPLFPLINISVN